MVGYFGRKIVSEKHEKKCRKKTTRDELKKDVKLAWTDKTKAEIAAAKGTSSGESGNSGSSNSGNGSSSNDNGDNNGTQNQGGSGTGGNSGGDNGDGGNLGQN